MKWREGDLDEQNCAKGLGQGCKMPDMPRETQGQSRMRNRRMVGNEVGGQVMRCQGGNREMDQEAGVVILVCDEIRVVWWCGEKPSEPFI